MRTFALNSDTNDMFLDANGDFAGYNSRIDDIAQLLICKIQTFLGEVPTNTALGLDWHGIIFDEFVIEQTKINELIRVIIATEGVRSIEDFSIAPNKQNAIAGYNFTIKTDAGDINFQNLINGNS
jgi:hypothetical protein